MVRLAFRMLLIADYEALYGPVGESERVEGGVVEFVLEGPENVRFLGVKKDGKPYNKLRWSED